MVESKPIATVILKARLSIGVSLRAGGESVVSLHPLLAFVDPIILHFNFDIRVVHFVFLVESNRDITKGAIFLDS